MPALVDALRRIWATDSPERENFISGIARYVSKLAALDVSDEELKALGEFFTTEDAVYLYVRIRDMSKRLESEWRNEFIRYFPCAAEALPPVEITEQQWTKKHGKWLERMKGQFLPPRPGLDDDIPF